jgi:hypothetical protein
MIKWTSQARSIRLPNGKTQVNFIYTAPGSVATVYDALSQSVGYFQEWDKPIVYVWLTSNEEEFLEANSRISGEPPENIPKVSPLPFFRTFYVNQELKKVVPFKSRYIGIPNFVVHLPEYKRLGGEILEAGMPHEVAHVIEIDRGYSTPITRTYNEMLDKYALDPFFRSCYSPIFASIVRGLDETSANEIEIDHGLEDKILFLTLKYSLENFSREIEIEAKDCSLSDKLYFALNLAHLPIPFRHKKKTMQEEKLMDFLLQGYRSVDMEEAFLEAMSAYDKVTNPPDELKVKGVFEYAVRKIRGDEDLELSLF